MSDGDDLTEGGDEPAITAAAFNATAPARGGGEHGARALPTLIPVYRPAEGAPRPLDALAPWTLSSPRIDVGRAVSDADAMRISDDARMSRHHATLLVDARRGAVTVENRSSNGTSVNGVRQERAALQDNDVVRMGDTLFVLRWRPLVNDDAELPGLVGSAPSMRFLRSQLALVGASSAWVLLLGETGTGKELCARALHECSGRRGRFVAVNCSAVPESLAESQLFGHRKGAFTGADRDQAGFFEDADGGTLFLDELGELPVALQPKLLRALDERKITRVGETTARAVDLRVVTATNRDLTSAIARGDFRADLYARLTDITLRLPPLRERREDILALLAHALGDEHPPLEPDLAEALLLFGWPYNVRELVKAATELKVRGRGEPALRLSLVAERLRTETAMTPAGDRTDASPAAAPRLPAALDDEIAGDAQGLGPPASEPQVAGPAPDRAQLVRLLTRYGGNVARIARATGRSRKQVYRWLEKHELDLEGFRT